MNPVDPGLIYRIDADCCHLFDVPDSRYKYFYVYTIFLQVYLCTVLFQVAEGSPLPDNVEQMVTCCSVKANPWLAYKLARQAMRYGQCGVAEKIFQAVAQKVGPK